MGSAPLAPLCGLHCRLAKKFGHRQMRRRTAVDLRGIITSAAFGFCSGCFPSWCSVSCRSSSLLGKALIDVSLAFGASYLVDLAVQLPQELNDTLGPLVHASISIVDVAPVHVVLSGEETRVFDCDITLDGCLPTTRAPALCDPRQRTAREAATSGWSHCEIWEDSCLS